MRSTSLPETNQCDRGMNFEQPTTILSRINFNDGDLIPGIDTVDRGAAGRCAL